MSVPAVPRPPYVDIPGAVWYGGQLQPFLASLALQAGFSDQSHFTRAFKRHTGCTPAQYRGLVRQ